MRVGNRRWVVLGLALALLLAAPLSWAGGAPDAEIGISTWFQTLTIQVQDWLSYTAEWLTAEEDEEPAESAPNEDSEPKEPAQSELGPHGEPFG